MEDDLREGKTAILGAASAGYRLLPAEAVGRKPGEVSMLSVGRRVASAK
jgi:hypothetical protein